MTQRTDWQGIFPAATTQFKDDQSLDIAGTLAHVDAMIAAGIDGLVMVGTLGENNSLEYREKIELLAATVAHVAGRIPVLSGVAEATTALACRYARDAQKVGADGLMVLPGVGYKSDERETVAHFRAVADASDLKIMIYNNPVAYGVDIKPETFAKLADEPKFVAIKESSDDTRRVTDIINACGDRYVIFCGVDDIIMEAFAVGARGWVSGLVNSFPAENRLFWDLMLAGRYDDAATVYRWYMPVLHLDTHVKLVQYIKLANVECGYGSEMVRQPRLPIVGEERERVLAIIREAIAKRPSRSDYLPAGEEVHA